MSKIRRNQQTGTLIEVGTAEELGLDDEGGASKWYCVCLEHSGILGHETRKLAKSWASSPLDWCFGCSEKGDEPTEEVEPTEIEQPEVEPVQIEQSPTGGLVLPSGRTVEIGEEITVLDPRSDERRRYRLVRVEKNGDVTCWGSIDKSGLTPNGSMRTFKSDRVVDVKHNKPRSRSIREQEDN
jgi:hypothetical protein